MEIFMGSYIDGCDVDLVHWCGLELTDAQSDQLWGNINSTDLLEQAGAYVETEEEIDDAAPGMNDTYYSVTCDDVDKFRESLKAEILSIISEKML